MSWKIWLFKIGAFLAIAGALLLKAFKAGRKSQRQESRQKSQEKATKLYQTQEARDEEGLIPPRD